MSTELHILAAGPSITVQDLGRPNLIGQGLSRGGAMDRLAILEATALLGSKAPEPALEMAGLGGQFQVSRPIRFALTGAPMKSELDGQPLAWSATHILYPGQSLNIGGVTAGQYGYLTFAGGLSGAGILGSHATHLAAGIGVALKAGDILPLTGDASSDAALMKLAAEDRFQGGTLRMIAGPQTELFSEGTLKRFLSAEFTRSALANRQGIRLDHATERFTSDLSAGLASDFIVPGDIQQTGQGIPYVLMAESQTTGGYPRIGTVIPDDLPKIAQAPQGARLCFSLLRLEEADALRQSETKRLADLRGKVEPLVRDPKDISDLLRYQLISGMTAGDDLEGT